MCFSYYGRKMKIIKKYPKPTKDTIIEPLCGSASYAYEYWDKNIIISDLNEKIYKIWLYLKDAKKEDILKLPNVENAENIKDKYIWMCDEERWLIGFCINNGSQIPKHTAGRMNFNSWNRDKIRIANDLYKFRHWNILNVSYESLENIDATWFIDPPYEFQKLYKHNDIDYDDLAHYCKTRKGQVIVCENDLSKKWLDFQPLTEIYGQRKRSKEVIWIKENQC